MTAAAAGVGEGLTSYGNELPIIAGRVKGELQNTVGIGVTYLAVGLDCLKWAKVNTARAYHELSDASCWIGFPAWVL